MSKKIDFFISHSHVDKQWAEWIANFLEQQGYSTFWGDRDLKVGDNFVSVIQEYIKKADKLIAIFSPSYFTSIYCQAEVSAMLARKKNGIIPVKVSDIQPTGKLQNVIYVDLYNADESEAKERLLKAVSAEKKMLSGKSQFPGQANSKNISDAENVYPGNIPISNFNFGNEKIVIGGEEKVSAIRQAFEKSNTVSSTLTLSGVGGSGKTVIAQKYVYQYGYLYDFIWWVNAQSKESIIHEYEEFVLRNNLADDITSKHDPNRAVDVVKKWMAETNNWLFIFDDVSDFETIQLFLPENHKGNVLITSRSRLWRNNDVSAITVDVFSTEKAIRYLKLQGVSGKADELITLSNVLGNLPANLQMASKYIVENNLTVSDFLAQFDKIRNDTADSAGTYINIASAYKEQGDFPSAINYYKMALGILEKKQDSNCISVYNSIASVYQEMGSYNEAEETYKRALEIVANGVDGHNLSVNSFDVGTTYNNLATILRKEKRYNEAIHLYDKAVEIFKNIFENEHPSIATTLNNLALVYCDLGEYARALEYYYQALSIREKILGLNHPDTAKIYIGIAEIYEIQGDNEKAVLQYEKALSIYNSALGAENPYVTSIFAKIASIYQKQGFYQKASDYYNRSLKVRHKPVAFDGIASSFINIIGENDNITNITSLSEKPAKSDMSKEVTDSLTSEVLSNLESIDEEGYALFNNYFSEFEHLIRVIKNELLFNTNSETEICHYSKLATLKCIIRKSDDKPQPRLRISNIAYLNDPSEGNVLLQLLKKYVKSSVLDMLYGNENAGENKLVQVPYSKVFIGSFSTAKNKLPMWTLYGDDSKGCCLVFDDYFFDKNNDLIEEKSNVEDKNIPSQELVLYQVKYLDIDKQDASDTFIGYFKDISEILDLFKDIISKHDSVRAWITSLLDEIRFLFKDSDYDYENEVRIIIRARDSEIQVDDEQNEFNVPRLYVNLQKELVYKEIILGSKVDKPNAVAPFLLHSGRVKKVTKSGISYQ